MNPQLAQMCLKPQRGITHTHTHTHTHTQCLGRPAWGTQSRAALGLVRFTEFVSAFLSVLGGDPCTHPSQPYLHRRASLWLLLDFPIHLIDIVLLNSQGCTKGLKCGDIRKTLNSPYKTKWIVNEYQVLLLLLISTDSIQIKLQSKRRQGRIVPPTLLQNHFPWERAMTRLPQPNSLPPCPPRNDN